MKRYQVLFIYRNEFVRTFWVTAINLKEANLFAQNEKETFCDINRYPRNRVRIEVCRG